MRRREGQRGWKRVLHRGLGVGPFESYISEKSWFHVPFIFTHIVKFHIFFSAVCLFSFDVGFLVSIPSFGESRLLFCLARYGFIYKYLYNVLFIDVRLVFG